MSSMSLTSVDVFGPQIASLGLDEGMPLGEEGDSYAVGQLGTPATRKTKTYPT